MPIKLNTKYLESFISEDDYKSIAPQIVKAHNLLKTKSGAGSDFLGWVTLPEDYDKNEFELIKASARKICENSQVLIVIGIGGSYLGARAVIEFIKSQNYNALPKSTPDIYFAGNTISSRYLAELKAVIGTRDFSVNVISKSGTTTEPAVAFRLFKEMLEERYGKEGAKERIFVTTDREKGTLKKFADSEGWQTMTSAADIPFLPLSVFFRLRRQELILTLLCSAQGTL